MIISKCPENKTFLVSCNHGGDGWSINCKGFLCFTASAADADQLVHNVPLQMFTDTCMRSWSFSALNILGVVWRLFWSAHVPKEIWPKRWYFKVPLS